MSSDPPNGQQFESDQRIERLLGHVLITGVAAAALVVLAGATVYLARHGGQRPDYRVFRGEPPVLRSVTGIVRSATEWSGRGLIQLGLLLLIATPVARVVFSLAAFLRQRDFFYCAVTLLVLGVLLLSLTGYRF